MTTRREFNVLLFQSIGELLYAIAASDNFIHEKESKVFKPTLQKLFEKKLPSEHVSLALNHAKTSFDYHNSVEADPQYCFNSFMTYKRSHEHIFTDDIKALVMGAATAMATAFLDKNKSELILLAKLDIELKKKIDYETQEFNYY